MTDVMWIDLSSTALSESFRSVVYAASLRVIVADLRLTRVVLLGGVTPACVSDNMSEIGFGGGVKCQQARIHIVQGSPAGGQPMPPGGDASRMGSTLLKG